MFTAQDVKELREKTGVGMMDCKRALTEANGDMDEAISILGRPDEEGRYEPLLPIAYFYRSTTGSNSKDELDGEDLAKAYSILRDGVMTGKVPDGVFSTVSNSYLVYLEGTDRTRADEVREELRDMGLFVSMGQSTVKSS